MSGKNVAMPTQGFQTDLMDKNWKRFERRVAERCGGQRISVADKKTDLDVHHSLLGIECKYRAKLSQYLKDWYEQEKNSSRVYALLDFDDLIKLTRK